MATSLPRFTIATRSESLSASSIMFVATITVEPSSLSSRIIFHISNRLGTSRKAVGSSNTAIFGRCARTLQSSTFFRIPPLISQVLLFLASQRSTARRTFSTPILALHLVEVRRHLQVPVEHVKRSQYSVDSRILEGDSNHLSHIVRMLNDI